MNSVEVLVKDFIAQANRGDLKTASYPKELEGLRVKVSFGMGAPARVPWIAFIAPEMQVSNGYYPVYLYYKEFHTLILAYGVSETNEFAQTWPPEIMNSTKTIHAFFDRPIPRYGDSFVFKAYRVTIDDSTVDLTDPETQTRVTGVDIDADVNNLLEYYKKIFSNTLGNVASPQSQGLFYMEKELENFLVENWENTELGEKYELIIVDGELVSQQFKTDIGPIDILAKDRQTKDYVVIELKKSQTSDDTVGQLARYMGWIQEAKGVKNVKGIIIAGQYDRRLAYALRMVPNTEVFLYEVNFKLKEFSS